MYCADDESVAAGADHRLPAVAGGTAEANGRAVERTVMTDPLMLALLRQLRPPGALLTVAVPVTVEKSRHRWDRPR